MANLSQLSKVFILNRLIDGTLKFPLSQLPRDLRQCIAQLRFESLPPSEWKTHFQVLNLLPFDFKWFECTGHLDSLKFTTRSYQYDNKAIHAFMMWVENPFFPIREKDHKRLLRSYLYWCDQANLSRIRQTVMFVRSEYPFTIQGSEIEVREDPGPVVLQTPSDELQFLWQTGPFERGGGVVYRGLWPIRLGRELYLLAIKYHERDDGHIYEPTDHEITIQFRPDPELTRGVDALILTPLTRPKLMFH